MKKTPQLILLNALKDSKPSIFSKPRRSDDWMASAFALSFVGYLVKQALDELIANDTKHHEWQLSSLLGTSLSLNTIYKVDEDVHLQVRVDALENLMALDSGLNELDGYHNRFVSKYLLADQANELQVTMQSAQDTESGALMDEVLAQRTAVEQSTETVTVDLNDLIVESPGRLPTVDLPQTTPPAIQTAAGIDWMEIGLEYMGLGLLALAGGEVFSFTSGLLSAAADPVYAGTLVDGYIGNARVYRVGADGVTPLDGVVRITDKFGRFEALPDGAGKIVVEAVRNADGTFASKDYGFNPTLGTSIDFTYSLTLSAPGGVSTSAGPLVINPITTLIQSYIEANPTTTVADASFLVASRLGLSTTFDFMHTDPVAAVGSANFSADPAALAANLQTALAVQKVSTQLANFMITVAQSTSFDANTGDESKSVLTSLVSYMDASTGVISLSTSATLSDVLSAGSVNVSEATLTTLAQANNFATQSLSRVGDLQKSIVGQMLNVNAASVDEALQNIQEMLTAVANNKTLLDVTFVDGQSVGYELGRLTTFTDSPEIKIDLSKIKSHLAVNDYFTAYDDRHDSINLSHRVTQAEIDQGFFKLTFPASSVSQFDSVVLRLNVTTRDGTDGVGLFTFTKDTLPRDGTAIQEANLAASTSGKFALATGVTTQAQANAAGDHGYGSFTVKSDGTWSYVMNSAHNEFAKGQSYTDSISINKSDGSLLSVLTVKIYGTNDTAVIDGVSSAALDESNSIQNASGSLTVTDVDSDQTFAAQANVAGSGGYGKFTITTDGQWSYAMDSAHNEMRAGVTYADSITVSSADGSQKVVTVTITGTNDAATISGTAIGSLTEASGANNAVAGVPTASASLTSVDIDNAANSFVAVSSPTVSTGGYGSYTMTAGGVWSYTLRNSEAPVQALNVGSTLTDTFTVKSIDGTEKIITITITGANDAAVVSGLDVGSVSEAGGVGNALLGNAVSTGTLTSSDVDNASTFVPVSSATASVGGLGTYTMTSNGVWTYNLNDASSGVQGLNAGQTLIDTFTVTTIDGTSKTVTVTINGANDAAVISGQISGAATEAGGVANAAVGTAASGTLTSTDVDNTANVFTTVSSATTSVGGYGTYTMSGAGAWTYSVNNSNLTVQGLNANQSLSDTFVVTSVDGTAQTVTVTINGANDAAVIGGVSTGSALEAGGVTNGTAGSVATGTLTSADVDNTANVFTALSSTATALGYGSYTMSGAGVWTYNVNNSNSTVQALNAGGTLTDTFAVTSVDGTSKTVTVTINGSNDAAAISGTDTGSALEAGGVANAAVGTNASGTLTSTDVDNDTNFTAVSSAATSALGYGNYTISSSGVWNYTVDNNNTTVQALNAGGTLTDTFVVTSVDGTAKTVTVTINGANDAPTGVASAKLPGGSQDATYAFTKAKLLEGFSDVDNANLSIVDLTVAVAGADQTSGVTLVGDQYQFLKTGAKGLATISYLVNDAQGGSVAASQAFYLTGTGELLESTAAAAGVSTIATGLTTSSLSVATTPIYGSASFSDGQWRYVLNNADSRVNALNSGQSLNDSFILSDASVVNVVINGANDAAVIGGVTTGAATEAGGVANDTVGTNASGTLTSSDVDNTANVFTTVSSAATSVGGYGTYTMSGAGAWTYSVNNSNLDVQKLNVGSSLTDTFVVTSVDGTAQTVTVTVNGANDAAVIGGVATGSALEAGGVTNGTAGSVATGTLTSADVDNTANLFTALSSTATALGYGSYTMSSAGVWTYNVNNSNSTVQALNAGGTLTDTFAVTSVDGTSKTVTVTINGANDAAAISGTDTGSALEAGGVANATAGTVASGTLTSTDVDNGTNSFTAVSSAATSALGYGNYTISSSGVWNYTVDNNNTTVQSLNAGGTLTDTFVVTSVDGTAKTVSVTINGANDAAVIGGQKTGAATESGGFNNAIAGTNATGTLTSVDIDNTANLFAASSGTRTYGSYTINTSGLWSYTVDNANTNVQKLNVGQSLADSFTVTSADGTSQVVNVAINGANDAPVFAATSATLLVRQGQAETVFTPVAASDMDAVSGGAITYRFKEGYNGDALTSGASSTNYFSIDSTTGAIKFLAPAAIDSAVNLTGTGLKSGVYTLHVVASDGTNEGNVLEVKVNVDMAVNGIHAVLPGSITDWSFKPIATIDANSDLIGDGFLMTNLSDSRISIQLPSAVSDVKFTENTNLIYTLSNDGTKGEIVDSSGANHTINISTGTVESMVVDLLATGAQTVVGTSDSSFSDLGDSINFREDVVHIDANLADATFNSNASGTQVLVKLNNNASNIKTLSDVEVVQFNDAIVRLIGAGGYASKVEAFNDGNLSHGSTGDHFYLASNSLNYISLGDNYIY